MTDVDGVSPPEVAPPAQASAGSMLRDARQAAGLHIAALAVSLKVPVAKLEALESDRIDLLPDAVFARALAASVCRALKIDAAPVLASLPQVRAPRLSNDDREGQQSTFRAPISDKRRAMPSSQGARGGRPVMVAVALLVLGGAVMAFWPQLSTNEWFTAYLPRNAPASTDPAASTPGGSNAPEGDGLQQTVVAPSEDEGVEQTGPAIAASGAASTQRSMAAAPSVRAAAPATVSASNLSAVAAAVASAAASEPSGLVAFDAKGASWVKVIDASGKIVFQKTLSAGESASTSGVAPLKVTVGRADLTEVHVRGQPFALTPFTRGDGVARFEVK